MRIIIRFSIDGEKNSKLGNKLRAILKTYKIRLKQKTSTYEGNIAPAKIGICLRKFWQTSAEYKGGPGRIDHFWMYADKPRKNKKKAIKKKTAPSSAPAVNQ